LKASALGSLKEVGCRDLREVYELFLSLVVQRLDDPQGVHDCRLGEEGGDISIEGAFLGRQIRSETGSRDETKDDQKSLEEPSYPNGENLTRGAHLRHLHSPKK
jgi:hypothetical protein